MLLSKKQECNSNAWNPYTFLSPSNILYVGGETEKNEYYTIESTTKEDDINKFVNKKSSDCKFLITTYDSCNKLLNNKFDFKIGDEAHHLVGLEKDTNKGYDAFHNINSKKSLFMTATEKVIENNRTNKVIMNKCKYNILIHFQIFYLIPFYLNY
jgi:hypothetical protein